MVLGMRVAHVGNMANDGFACVEALREAGVDAELIIDENDFGMGLPQWETTRIEGDPYNMKPNELPPAPSWVKTWRGREMFFLDRVVKMNRMTRDYDLLHLHFPTMLYLCFSKTPYMVYEAGFVRQLIGPDQGNSRLKLGARAYRNAEAVTYTNTDTAEMVQRLHPKRMRFLPFAINTERYKPGGKRDNSVLELLHPARMVFDVKGNDRMLRAYKRFIEEGNRAHLTLIDWGYEENVAEAHHIVEPIKEYVTWLKPMSKPALIEAYQRCDAVLDQFTLGASGTTGFEAMSCGAPLMMYFADSAKRHFGESPPCVNASTEEEILAGFTALQSDTLRRHLAIEGRAFVERHLSYPKIVSRLLKIYSEVIPDDIEAD